MGRIRDEEEVCGETFIEEDRIWIGAENGKYLGAEPLRG